jgi:hypothetical protein
MMYHLTIQSEVGREIVCAREPYEDLIDVRETVGRWGRVPPALLDTEGLTGRYTFRFRAHAGMPGYGEWLLAIVEGR